MSKLFEIRLSTAPDEILAKARQTAQSSGVQLSGDHEAGRFFGNGMEGTYRIDGDTLAIRILKKPFILPWTLIESSIRNYFA
ncbi:MAG TPA: hypothetical protein VLU73_12600 [Methylococcaceae bacterium]|jgi:hypothetical protein|nr:hypothetical protein [Methylococcaceae bacterium]